ncbi:MAG: cupin domain-containing protein [bacterium]|jgi:quercetin dioxygenase-like cupin family protein|nr:cupin domain-containing protein [bacterium]
MAENADELVARVVAPGAVEPADVMGVTMQWLTLPEEGEGAPCVLRAMLPPGLVVPLHSHADPETFVPLEGAFEGLSVSAAGHTWVKIAPGDVFHIPGDAHHALRNASGDRAVTVLVTTPRMGRFFTEVSTPAVAGAPPSPPSAETVRRFLETAARYGYWNGGPEENERLGITLPSVP